MIDFNSFFLSKDWRKKAIFDNKQISLQDINIELQSNLRQINLLRMSVINSTLSKDSNNMALSLCDCVLSPQRFLNKISPNVGNNIMNLIIEVISDPKRFVDEILLNIKSKSQDIVFLATVTFPSVFFHFISDEYSNLALDLLLYLMKVGDYDVSKYFFASFIFGSIDFFNSLWTEYHTLLISNTNHDDSFRIFLQSIKRTACFIPRQQRKLMQSMKEHYGQQFFEFIIQDIILPSYLEYSNQFNTDSFPFFSLFFLTNATSHEYGSRIWDVVFETTMNIVLPHHSEFGVSIQTPVIMSFYEVYVFQQLIGSSSKIPKILSIQPSHSKNMTPLVFDYNSGRCFDNIKVNLILNQCSKDQYMLYFENNMAKVESMSFLLYISERVIDRFNLVFQQSVHIYDYESMKSLYKGLLIYRRNSFDCLSSKSGNQLNETRTRRSTTVTEKKYPYILPSFVDKFENPTAKLWVILEVLNKWNQKESDLEQMFDCFSKAIANSDCNSFEDAITIAGCKGDYNENYAFLDTKRLYNVLSGIIVKIRSLEHYMKGRSVYELINIVTSFRGLAKYYGIEQESANFTHFCSFLFSICIYFTQNSHIFIIFVYLVKLCRNFEEFFSLLPERHEKSVLIIESTMWNILGNTCHSLMEDTVRIRDEPFIIDSSIVFQNL